MTNLLEVRNLRTHFQTYAGTVQAVNGVSFSVAPGEALGIVGESGCGKSVTATSIMRLLPPNGKIVEGSIDFNGRDLVKLSEHEMQQVRGNEISMIFQDPMTSLNPVLKIRTQISESLQLHQHMTKAQAAKRSVELLELVGIPSPAMRVKQYPHEFSGGMRQRVMIAMALSCNPKLLIADEPTTALDVTIQAQIMDLMRELRQKLNTAIILITHDLGVVAGMCTRIQVMYAGRIIERGLPDDIYYHPKHPYTWGLLKSVPRLDAKERTKLHSILGQPPDLLAPPEGCEFWPRCDYAMHICQRQKPELTKVAGEHEAACWLLHPAAAAHLAAKGGPANETLVKGS
ncbi:MAG: ABC transporter ATP-binding protein [Bacillota bacterium]|jgi:oligopeptide transport system ATP-binding protein